MGRRGLESFMLPERNERLLEVAGNRTRNLVVVLDGVHDPHNLSAAVRSCDAFGLLDIHAVESQARFRISRRVCQGAQKWLDLHRWPDPASCASDLTGRGFELWVADVQPGSQPVDDLPWDRKVALVFGNEHQGASETMRQAASGRFHIPMFGFTESFNISVSVGITLALAVRGRARMLGGHGDLPAEERETLVGRWQRRSVRASKLILDRLARDREGEDGP